MMIYCQHCRAQIAHDAKVCWCEGNPRIGHMHIVLGWSFAALLLGYFAVIGDFRSPIFIAGVIAVGVCVFGQIVHIKRRRDQIVDGQPHPFLSWVPRLDG